MFNIRKCVCVCVLCVFVYLSICVVMYLGPQLLCASAVIERKLPRDKECRFRSEG